MRQFAQSLDPGAVSQRAAMLPLGSSSAIGSGASSLRKRQAAPEMPHHWQRLGASLPPLSPQESVSQLPEPGMPAGIGQRWRCHQLAPTLASVPAVSATLAELEQQLLGEEAGALSSVCHAGSANLDGATNWADVLEELLHSGEDASPTTTTTTVATTHSTLSIEPSMVTPDSNPPHLHLLVACAQALSEQDFNRFDPLFLNLSRMASIYMDDPSLRLAAHLSSAFLQYKQQILCGNTTPLPWPSSSSSSSCSSSSYSHATHSSSPSDIIAATQALYRATPYYEFGYMAANSAIMEALKGHNRIHIVDFDIRQGNQWVAMIRACAARPAGPPQLRITGVHGPQLHAYKGGVQLLKKTLESVAEALQVQFEFCLFEMEASDMKVSMIEMREGEALAVNMAFQLHRVPDESVCMANPRDRLLRMVHAWEPKVVTLVEYEANTNTSPFLPRFMETLEKYTAMFESLDAAFQAKDSHDERVSIEQHCLVRRMMNMVLCEGRDRIERCEWFKKWQVRMNMAGFHLWPLIPLITNNAKMLLMKYPSQYFLKEEGGALCLGWRNTILVVASAWKV